MSLLILAAHLRTINLPFRSPAFVVLSTKRSIPACQLSISHFANDNEDRCEIISISEALRVALLLTRLRLSDHNSVPYWFSTSRQFSLLMLMIKILFAQPIVPLDSLSLSRKNGSDVNHSFTLRGFFLDLNKSLLGKIWEIGGEVNKLIKIRVSNCWNFFLQRGSLK